MEQRDSLLERFKTSFYRNKKYDWIIPDDTFAVAHSFLVPIYDAAAAIAVSDDSKLHTALVMVAF